jgi:hypothetical protein
MTANGLLRLYPRAWQERYGGELLDTVGENRLTFQQVIDITMGAIDAWVSADVRRSTASGSAPSDRSATPQKGRIAMFNARVLCRSSRTRVTVRDQITSAIVMLAATALLSAAGIWLNRSGYQDAGKAVKGVAFPLALMVSMPFGILKGQPWRAQAVLIGGTVLFLILIAVLSTRI